MSKIKGIYPKKKKSFPTCIQKCLWTHLRTCPCLLACRSPAAQLHKWIYMLTHAMTLYSGVVPNIRGRVLHDTSGDPTLLEEGLYVCGWLKRGPTGIIATNLYCAEETVSDYIVLHRMKVQIFIYLSKRRNTTFYEVYQKKKTFYENLNFVYHISF